MQNRGLRRKIGSNYTTIYGHHISWCKFDVTFGLQNYKDKRFLGCLIAVLIYKREEANEIYEPEKITRKVANFRLKVKSCKGLFDVWTEQKKT